MTLLAVMLVQIRNFFGFLAVIGVGVALGVVSWLLPPDLQAILAYLLTWMLLVAAPKPVLELIGQRRRRGTRSSRASTIPGSDVDQLAALTRTPAWVWLGLFLLANLAGLALGASLLLPALMELITSLAS